MKVRATIPKLKVIKGGLERSKEVYVVCISTDSSAPVGGGLRAKLAAVGQSISSGTVVPEVGVEVSPVITKIKKGVQMPISGEGFNLYREKDPGGNLEMIVMVVESDEDMAGLMGQVKTALQSQVVTGLLSSAAATVSPVSVLVSAMPTLFGALDKISEDDVLLMHYHSGTELSMYGMIFHDEHRVGSEYADDLYLIPLKNENVDGVMAVELLD